MKSAEPLLSSDTLPDNDDSLEPMRKGGGGGDGASSMVRARSRVSVAFDDDDDDDNETTRLTTGGLR